MTRIKLAFVTTAALALLAVTPVPAAPAATLLKGTVGPGFTISLKTASGQRVKTLRHGTYRIRVVDKSNIHNFHLRGPGVNKKITTVGFKGTKTVTVRLLKGRYTYVCDPHSTTMKGSFRVT